MFDPYAESLSSTGEPPTVQTESSRSNMYASQSICHGQVLSSTLTSGSRSRTLSVQEPDSGYEASPSSIADNQRFFGDQTMGVTNQIDLVQSCNLNADIEFDFDECDTRFSESESDLDDYDTCQESSSSFPQSCNCSRTDSSNTNVTAICDNSRCNSSDLSFNRPSSNPIQVPNQQQSCRISPDIRSRLEHSLGSLLDMYPEARSLPISFSHLQTLGFIPEHHHHLSWPPHSAHSALNRRRVVALPSPRSHHICLNRDNPRRSRSFNHPRSRRQMIDSEASSFCSSDEEGPEDVFNMSAEEPSVSVVTVGSVPLPDIVLESTDSVRRGRSVSVNLPLDRRDEVIRDIGQRLRRMSDLFDQRRELCIAVMHLRSRRASDGFDSRPNGVS